MLNRLRTKTICTIVALGALLAFAGCGGDDEEPSGDAGSTTTTETQTETQAETASGGGELEQYKEDFLAAGEDFKKATQTASSQTQSAQTTQGRVEGLEALETSVTEAADDFESLDPPENVQADHDELVGQFRSLADNVDAVKQALQSEDQEAAQAAAKKLQQNQSSIQQTLESIRQKVEGSAGSLPHGGNR